MRKTCPSSYDPRLTSDDIREFKRILRATSNVAQNIKDARWLDDEHARVWAGGSIGGDMIEFVKVDGEWKITEVSSYMS